MHQAAAYWVIGTNSFDKTGAFSLTSQGYVSAAHEDIEFPAIAAEGSAWQDGGNDGAIMTFTLSGNGGPTGADGGGFYPSTAYGRLTSTSGGLVNSTINIADLGQSPQDGFTEYGHSVASAQMGRLQLGGLHAGDRWADLLRHELHPVPKLHGLRFHADDRNLWWNAGRECELGNFGQLRRSLTISTGPGRFGRAPSPARHCRRSRAYPRSELNPAK